MTRRNGHGQQIGDALPAWQARPAPSLTPMVGRFVRLQPIDVARDADDLFEAFSAAPDGRDWTYMSAGPFADRAAFDAYVTKQAASKDPLHHVIRSASNGVGLGTAAFMRIDSASGVIEIGHIALSPALQRTAGATEAIFLMMCRAFDELGYRRLEWKCDALNVRSRRAAERLGFVFEGIFRQAVVMRGRNRDTAWYAIIDKDWPQVKRAIALWLAADNFDPANRQICSLAAIRLEQKEIRVSENREGIAGEISSGGGSKDADA